MVVLMDQFYSFQLFKPFRCAGKSRQGVVNESFMQ
jgi:hypothetical protein